MYNRTVFLYICVTGGRGDAVGLKKGTFVTYRGDNSSDRYKKEKKILAPKKFSVRFQHTYEII